MPKSDTKYADLFRPLRVSELDAERAFIENNQQFFLVDSHEDADDSTVFDYDTGEMSEVYDIWKVIGVFAIEANVTTSVYAQVNGITAGNYCYNVINAGAVSQTTGDTRWVLTTSEKGTLRINILLRGGSGLSPYGWNFPTIGAVPMGESNRTQILNGYYDGNVGDINQIRIFSTENMTGRIRILGADVNVKS